MDKALVSIQTIDFVPINLTVSQSCMVYSVALDLYTIILSYLIIMIKDINMGFFYIYLLFSSYL